MTLKAKVEAIVYAAEEPVTLAQLSGIFSSEVLEDLAATEAQSLQQLDEGEADAEAQTLWEEPRVPETSDSDGAPHATPDGAAGESGSVAPQNADAEEKKAARARDRRVREALQIVLDELIADYSNGQRGMEIREIAGGYRMATKPEYHDAVRGFVKSLKPPMKLSLQALETLAVIAYKQPVTAPEVSEIRGVDSGGVLGSLVARKLITTAGRKHVIGRPILYKTTREFLLRFGLKDLNELPSVEEFEKMAGELAQAEAEAEDAAMRSSDLPLASGEIAPLEVSREESLAREDTDASGDEDASVQSIAAEDVPGHDLFASEASGESLPEEAEEDKEEIQH